MTSGSLVSRLIWLLTSAMAGLWLLGSVTTGMLTVFEINERLDNAIEEVAQRLLPATYDAVREPQGMQEMARRMVATMDPRALAYQIIGPSGDIAMRSENAPAIPFPAPSTAGFHNVPRYRIYAQPAAAKGYVIEVAEPLMHRHEALRRAVMLSVGPLLLFLPLSWLLIRWVVLRAMHSLTHLRKEISRRDGSNLSRIPDPGMPAELSPILTAVNRLLERLERALATERQFAANSAHELRTPIAGVLAQMQLLAGQLAGTPSAERAIGIVAQVKGLGSLAEKLLQLSRTGAGLVLQRQPIDVIAVLQLLLDEFRRVEGVPDRLRLIVTPGADFVVQGDIDVLGIMLRNLIENAIRYGAADQPIDVMVERGRRIRVLNGAPVIPPEALEVLKKPFVRRSAVGAGGGLGLAIVDNIMKQFGGDLVIASPVAGRADGFEAGLIFPFEPHDSPHLSDRPENVCEQRLVP